MKTQKTSAIIVLCVLSAICGGCSKRNHKAQNQETPHDRMVALARQFDCPILGDEINKVAGSNAVDSIQIQRALKNNARFASEARLCDLVQAGEKVEAIFQIERAGKFECAAQLECPTNFIPELSSHTREWAIVFEPGENHEAISISQLGDGNDVVVSGLIIEGKLTGLEALPPRDSGTKPDSAQSANSAGLAEKQLIDRVNADGHDGIFYLGLAREFGFPSQSVYPCRHYDTPDKLRSLYSLSFGGTNCLVIMDVHSNTRWAFVLDAHGHLDKALVGLKGQPSSDVTTNAQAIAQLAVEKAFWSAWLAMHRDFPAANPNMPTNQLY